MDERPALEIVFGPFQVDAMVALPGSEFNPAPETGPIAAVFLSVQPVSVPRLVDADTFERWDWLLAFRRVDVPGLRYGTVVRAPEIGGGPIKRWFVDLVEERGDEVRAFVKRLPDED